MSVREPGWQVSGRVCVVLGICQEEAGFGTLPNTLARLACTSGSLLWRQLALRPLRLARYFQRVSAARTCDLRFL